MVMANIYTMCGKYDEALSKLDYLLSQESNYTVNDVKLNKVFEPLRALPEYQTLMKKYALKPGV